MIPIVRWLLLGAFLACSGKLFSIRIRESSTVTIPKSTVLEDFIGDLGLDDFTSLDLTMSEELQNRGIEPGDIQETFLVELSLEALDPPDADLAFIDELDVLVDAPDLPRVLIASQDNFPLGEARVELDLEGIDLTPYVVSRSMTIVSEIAGNRPEEATEVDVSFVLRVGVTGQGACNQL